MLQEPMMEKLLAMRLHGMADALKTQEQDPGANELSFLERLALLVDHQWNWRQTRRWHGDCKLPSCEATHASKRSTIVRRADWTRA